MAWNFLRYPGRDMKMMKEGVQSRFFARTFAICLLHNARHGITRKKRCRLRAAYRSCGGKNTRQGVAGQVPTLIQAGTMESTSD